MDAAVLTMLTALFAAVLASAFDQRREAGKTRDKLDENSDAIRDLAARTTILEASHQSLLQQHQSLHQQQERLHQQHQSLHQHHQTLHQHHQSLHQQQGTFHQQLERLHEAIGEQRRISEKNHAEVTGSLSDTRERLARIEGRLEIGFQPNPAA